ncbi:unnamed protein product, partial [Gulo gulo]
TSYSRPLGFRDPSRRQEQTPALGSVLPSAPVCSASRAPQFPKADGPSSPTAALPPRFATRPRSGASRAASPLRPPPVSLPGPKETLASRSSGPAHLVKGLDPLHQNPRL